MESTENDSLLHPLIQAGLAAARVRVQHYKKIGVIHPSKGAGNLVDLIQQQAKDFKAFKQKQKQASAERRLKARAALVQKING